MLELKVNKGLVMASASGSVLELMAEISLGFGHMLFKTLHDCPDKELKKTFVKGIFEMALEAMQEMEAEEENDTL